MSEKELKKLVTRLTNLFEAIYALKNESGLLIYSDFQRLPSRLGTDYYKFITRPISLHTIGRSVKRLNYKNAQGFVNDLAQITWNARHYNEPGSQIYENALILDKFIHDSVIPKLSSDPVIPDAASLHYPDLGPIENFALPHADDQFPAVSRNEKAEVKHEPETGEEPTYSNLKSPVKSQQEGGARRGRPPIIDKPYEARIKSILKYLKRVTPVDDLTYNLTNHFERLPDKTNVDYFQEIRQPISLNEIRVKVRSRKYADVQQFLNDLNLMISNAKKFNFTDPEMMRDIIAFQEQVQTIIQREMLRPESDFVVTPSSGGDRIRTHLDLVSVRGKLYKVGDWVLIRNPNDSLKPIVSQIFKLWSADGVQYTNVCWYMRPEQTCHRVDRLFYKNEVFKTGEYSDHRADDILGPCYVVFLTHYQKGDIPPNLLPKDTEWFICEFRYNSNTYVFNKIRTWKACLPDEVRHVDQPVVPLSEPRKLIKYDSPIKHMLTSDAIDDTRVAPTEGIEENGPPIIGAVYLKSPFYNDDLGQTSTSPNVVPAPEYDNKETGRKAYIFTPLSQLKSITNPGAYSTTGNRSVSNNLNQSDEHEPHKYTQYGTGHSLRQFSKSENSPAFRDATPTALNTYQTVTSIYSAVYPGGVVSYVDDKIEDPEVQTIESLSELLIKSGGKTVWFRAPPINVGERFITPVSHSAKYLAWKLKKSQKIVR